MPHQKPAVHHASYLAANRAAYWRRQTWLLAAEINSGWWLSFWLPWVLFIGIAGTFALLWTRWQAPRLTGWTWGAIGAALLVAAVVAFLQARRSFESLAAARVLLEERLGLHARLSSAAAGVGQWPERRIDLDTRWPVRIRWQRMLLAILFVAGMLELATIVPIADAGAVERHTIESPTDAAVVTDWLDQLRREKAIDETSAEELAERVDSLLERPKDSWYEHATLEATGTLREQTAADLAQLARNLASAARAAEDLAAAERSPGDAASDDAASALAAAAGKLSRGGIRPGARAAERLGASRPDSLGDLSAEDLTALAEAFRDNRAALEAALAKGKNFDLSALGPDADDLLGGNCENCKPCGECERCKNGKACKHGRCAACAGRHAGRGGINRGPGEAPMRAGQEEDLATRRVEQIEAPTDIARAAAGELLEVVDGQHAVDEGAYQGPQVGGRAKLTGDGGGPTRVDNLLPREQDAVRRFFK